jgi:hypothetical protein
MEASGQALLMLLPHEADFLDVLREKGLQYVLLMLDDVD